MWDEFFIEILYRFHHENFTFSNCSRLQAALPKNWISIGCWILNMIRGKTRCTLTGTKCQSMLLVTSTSSSNALLKRWPASLVKNTEAIAVSPQTIDSNNTKAFMLSRDWKQVGKVRQFPEALFVASFDHKKILNYFRLDHEQRGWYYNDGNSEQKRNWEFK